MSRTWVPAGLREMVRQRAKGRCEYCLTPEVLAFALHQVDHIVAEKHGGPTLEENLALCCIACNQFKGTDFSSVDPFTRGRTPLFDPRKHQWRQHFRLDGPHIRPLTDIGRATARLLHFNDPERVAERGFFIVSGHFTPPPH